MAVTVGRGCPRGCWFAHPLDRLRAEHGGRVRVPGAELRPQRRRHRSRTSPPPQRASPRVRSPPDPPASRYNRKRDEELSAHVTVFNARQGAAELGGGCGEGGRRDLRNRYHGRPIARDSAPRERRRVHAGADLTEDQPEARHVPEDHAQRRESRRVPARATRLRRRHRQRDLRRPASDIFHVGAAVLGAGAVRGGAPQEHLGTGVGTQVPRQAPAGLQLEGGDLQVHQEQRAGDAAAYGARRASPAGPAVPAVRPELVPG